MTEFIPPGSRFVDLPSPFPIKRGGALVGARMACETWGTLDAARGNAILILTGLSPDAHAASHADDATPGWWEAMLGPGKPIDTDRWFVICVNSLGSCKVPPALLRSIPTPARRIGSGFRNCRSKTAPTRPRMSWPRSASSSWPA